MTRFFLLLILPLLFSCQDKKEKTQTSSATDAQPAKEIQPIVIQLNGHYNSEEDAWENPDSTFDRYISFHKEPHASFSRLDEEENSIGMGLIDKKGKVVVQPVYAGLSVGFTNGLCEVRDSLSKIGLVNLQGIEIVKPQYDYVYLDRDHMAVDTIIIKVGKNEKEGFINKKGEIVIPIKYESIELAGEGLLWFMRAPQQWGVMDYKENVIIEPVFTYVSLFKNGKTTSQKEDGEDYTLYKDGRVVKE